MVLGHYIVLDIETTGLSKKKHSITEIAAVKVKDGYIIDKFETLINPQCHIPSFITRLTGIDDEMVKDAPLIKQALPEFFCFAQDSVMVAHNASFDHGFIHHNAQEFLNQDFLNPRLCTRKLASRLLPDLPSKKLSCICDHMGIINSNAHRAMSDVVATYQVFENMVSMFSDYGITSSEDLFKFEKTSPSKIRQTFSIRKQ